MQLTGEITSGAVMIVVTLLTLGGGYLLTAARQNTKFDMMIAALQTDIKTNREAYTSALVEIRADLKSQDRSLDEVKLQLAAMSSIQNMGNLLTNLPQSMGQVIAQAMRDAEQKRKDAA